jgi:hypothetical protein
METFDRKLIKHNEKQSNYLFCETQLYIPTYLRISLAGIFVTSIISSVKLQRNLALINLEQRPTNQTVNTSKITRTLEDKRIGGDKKRILYKFSLFHHVFFWPRVNTRSIDILCLQFQSKFIRKLCGPSDFLHFNRYDNLHKSEKRIIRFKLKFLELKAGPNVVWIVRAYTVG